MKRDFNFDNLPKKHPFKTPEGYFDKLPNRIMQQTANRPASSNSLVWSWAAIRNTVVASLVLLIVFLGVIKLNQPEELTSTALLAQVNNQEIMDYLLSTEKIYVSDLTDTKAAEIVQAQEFINVQPEDLENMDPVLVDDYFM